VGWVIGIFGYAGGTIKDSENGVTFIFDHTGMVNEPPTSSTTPTLKCGVNELSESALHAIKEH
jgi:hypothetical protein